MLGLLALIALGMLALAAGGSRPAAATVEGVRAEVKAHGRNSTPDKMRLPLPAPNNRVTIDLVASVESVKGNATVHCLGRNVTGKWTYLVRGDAVTRMSTTNGAGFEPIVEVQGTQLRIRWTHTNWGPGCHFDKTDFPQGVNGWQWTAFAEARGE